MAGNPGERKIHVGGVEITVRELTSILDQVEVHFLYTLIDYSLKKFGRIKAGRDFTLPEIDRRGDNCGIYFQLEKTRDCIERSVEASVERIKSDLYLAVGTSAWKDEPHPDGSGTRHWQYEKIALLPIPLNTMRLRRILTDAIQTVSGWNEQNLIRKAPIPHFIPKRVDTG